MQVEVALELDRQVLDGDAGGGGVGRVADGEAVAQRAEDLLDRVGGGVGAAQAGRLVGGTGANSRTVADERKPPSQRTSAFHVVLATSGADWIFSARLATAPMLTALIGSVLVLTGPPALGRRKVDRSGQDSGRGSGAAQDAAPLRSSSHAPPDHRAHGPAGVAAVHRATLDALAHAIGTRDVDVDVVWTDADVRCRRRRRGRAREPLPRIRNGPRASSVWHARRGLPLVGT